MNIAMINCLVLLFDTALAAAEERYWDEREAEALDFSNYYHSQYSAF